MSSCSKPSSAGKSDTKNRTQSKTEHHVKSLDPPKYDKQQPKSDHIKHTYIMDNRINSREDIIWQERIKQVMDLTRRSEDEVIMALHDSDGDLNRAVNDLLEGLSPEWEVKKKKARQSTGPRQNSEPLDIPDNSTEWEDKRCLHNGDPPRIRGRANHNNRGWRRRENKENEKNVEDAKNENSSGAHRRGRGISGKSGRGGRGGGRTLGPRTFASRNDSSGNSYSHSFTRPIDTWTGNEQQLNHGDDSKMVLPDSWNTVETVEDWDNEEYTGSLADTKVFTPSSLTNEVSTSSDKSENGEQMAAMPEQSTNLITSNESTNNIDVPTKSQESIAKEQPCPPLTSISSMHLTRSVDELKSESLSAAQSDYLNQLTQKTADCLSTGSGQSTFLSVINSQSQRQVKHRPRVPPPSKIPSSAVEMPGDALNSSISFLDVQFGALEFGSDANINDGSIPDKFSSPVTNTIISSMESSPISAKSSVNSIMPVNTEIAQTSTSQKFIASTKTLRSDNQCVTSENSVNTTGCYTSRATSSQSLDIQKQDLSVQTTLDNLSAFNSTVTYQQSKSSYPAASVTTSNYSAYSGNAQTNQTAFICPTTACNSNNFSAIASVNHTGYNSSYTQSNITTFSQTSPSSSSSSAIYIQTSTTPQSYQSNSAFTNTSISQYPTQPVSTNSSYINSAYQNPTFQASSQTYQPCNTTFTSSMSQESSVYSNAVQSVYSGTYPNYSCQNQVASQDHKLTAGKNLHFEAKATTTTSALVTTAVCTLGLSSTSINASQTKTTVSNAVPKSSVSSLAPISSSNSITGSGTTGNIGPILSHQYIMGQSVPYATFQQPHMYSYEDLQLMQQRIPHMPTTGYYDASVGYQTTGPVTSLGNSRTDALSGVQNVQSVQAVQGQYTNINDARFTRADSNSSPVSSTISQQTASQHQQPLINPIPPGYAYFYGGGIMPASGFQYGTPAIYPQIATAGSAGTTSATYNTKPGNYNSGYGSGTNYDSLTNSGQTGDYKSNANAYSSSQTSKNGSSTGNTNAGSSSTDINAVMYTKGHVALNKVNSYEKQAFHSATPPPFGLTNNQNANVISGYGTAHLFIPTVPHQLHQPLHQDGGNSSGQRTNTNSQSKAQVKPGYSTSYWAGSN